MFSIFVVGVRSPRENNFIMKYVLGKNSINDIELDDNLFENEEVEYLIANREDLINHLIDWISEATTCKELMKADLKMLMGWDCEYILSSVSTNEYLESGDAGFDEACKELLELNSTLT